MIQAIGTFGLVIGAAAATLFVVLYHLSARWWHSEEGCHLMTFTAAVAASLDYAAVRTLTAAPRALPLGVGVIRAAIYCTIAVLLLWRLWMLYRLQIRPELRRRQGGRNEPRC